MITIMIHWRRNAVFKLPKILSNMFKSIISIIVFTIKTILPAA